MSGFIFALPVIFYQIWAFVAPGLYARERRFAIPFVVTSTALFLGGGYFGWKLAFPVAFKYLLDFSGSVKNASISINIEPTVMIGDYIEFISRMLLAFGAVFELPVLVFFLSMAGIVNHTHLIKFSRYFVVLAFFIAAIITPPDIMSQFLLAIPLCLLYVVSIGIAWAMGRKTPPSSTP
jgi:sec-independent protein translocase protein TatC